MRVRIIPDAEMEAYDAADAEARSKIGTVHESELNIRDVDENLAAFREESEGVEEIVLTQSVLDGMMANGITLDEVVGLIISKMGKAQ